MKEKPSITLTLPVTEAGFYKYFFGILDISKPKEEKLSPKELELAITLAGKPLNFKIDSKKSKDHQSGKQELAKELKIHVTTIYGLIKGLLEKEILIKDEDDFIGFPQTTNDVRGGIKHGLIDFNYILNFKIKK